MATRIEHTKEGIRSEVWGEDSILDTLQHELLSLKDKIESARKKEDYGTYKNLILAFKEVVHLVHEEEDNNKWKEFSSHYYEGDKAIKGENEYIALWEQNGNDDIRNHRIFKVEKEIKKDSFLNDDTLDKIEDIIGYKVFTRKYGHTDSIGNVFNDIGGAWSSISQEQQIEIIKLLNKQ